NSDPPKNPGSYTIYYSPGDHSTFNINQDV
ncbi:unnamed protein product, partial [marine sediment metagenome]